MSGPVRVKLSRSYGWRMPLDTVKVDRSTMWGNPFTIQDVKSVLNVPDCHAPVYVVTAYRLWLGGSNNDWMGKECEERRAAILARLPELRGKNLACWCPLDKPCHADVLLELANGDAEP